MILSLPQRGEFTPWEWLRLGLLLLKLWVCLPLTQSRAFWVDLEAEGLARPGVPDAVACLLRNHWCVDHRPGSTEMTVSEAPCPTEETR